MLSLHFFASTGTAPTYQAGVLALLDHQASQPMPSMPVLAILQTLLQTSLHYDAAGQGHTYLLRLGFWGWHIEDLEQQIAAAIAEEDPTSKKRCFDIWNVFCASCHQFPLSAPSIAVSISTLVAPPCAIRADTIANLFWNFCLQYGSKSTKLVSELSGILLTSVCCCDPFFFQKPLIHGEN